MVTLYGMDSKNIDVADIFLAPVKNPCVKWPPSGKSRPMMRPWGSTRAAQTLIKQSDNFLVLTRVNGEICWRAGVWLDIDAPFFWIEVVSF